jgi:DNA-binding NtrC family response regulator
MPPEIHANHRWDILVIEAEGETVQALRGLIDPGLRAEWAGSAAEGEKFLRENEVLVVICADDLPDLPGLMFLAQTRDLWPTTQRILMCHDLDSDLLLHTMREGGVFHYLPKPLDPEATAHLIDHALRQSRLMGSLSATRRRLDEAEVRVAHLGSTPARTSRWMVGTGSWLLLWMAAAGVLILALVLLGFTGLYLLKSYLGVDIYPDIHLQDLLRR